MKSFYGFICMMVLVFCVIIGIKAMNVLWPTEAQVQQTEQNSAWESQHCLSSKPEKIVYQIGETVGYIAAPRTINALYSPQGIEKSFEIPARTILSVIPGGGLQTWKYGDHIRVCLGDTCGWISEKQICWVSFP
jgi:hypothetical protein